MHIESIALALIIQKWLSARRDSNYIYLVFSFIILVNTHVGAAHIDQNTYYIRNNLLFLSYG